MIPFLQKLKNSSFFPIQQVSIKGDADFILNARGKFIWLELKKDGGVLSPIQIYKADWVKETGGTVLIATPTNWESMKAFLLLEDS